MAVIQALRENRPAFIPQTLAFSGHTFFGLAICLRSDITQWNRCLKEEIPDETRSGLGLREAFAAATDGFRSMSDAGLIDLVLREKSGWQLRSGAVRIVFLVGGNWIMKIPA